MTRWGPLMVLAAAQLLLVLDTAVMNVSISTLVQDLETDVVAIQRVITTYSLVMAALMVTGGKFGDRWGRRRALGLRSALLAVAGLAPAALRSPAARGRRQRLTAVVHPQPPGGGTRDDPPWPGRTGGPDPTFVRWTSGPSQASRSSGVSGTIAVSAGASTSTGPLRRRQRPPTGTR